MASEPPAPDPPKSSSVSASAVTRSRPRTRNGHRHRHRHRHRWSQIPTDPLRLVFERLGFSDFQRAKSVCSSWESTSRKSQPNNQIPWLILFPKEKNHALLLNPEEEEEKLYKTQDLGNNFAKSFCLATYRSWLLMQYKEDDQYNFYILDLLTRERIILPTLESSYLGFTSPILWIDEKTIDYLVIGMVDKKEAVSFKNGDDSWNSIPQLSGIKDFLNMVYKNQKLYCLNYEELKIFDFFGDIPMLVLKVSVSGCLQKPIGGMMMRLPDIAWEDQLCHCKTNVVVTLSGDILIVKSTRRSLSKTWEFEIYQMDLDLGSKWLEIVSLGDETILLDLGITVLPEDLEGIESNSIYFNGKDFKEYYYEFDKNEIFIYNLDTMNVEQPPQFVSSSIPFSNGRWFLPSFKRE